MKLLVITILVILGFYFLLDHYAPTPLSHEHFGFYQHDKHNVIGFIFLIAAGLVFWKWKSKG